MKKAKLTDGSTNVFACKNGKTFLDKNNLSRLVRDKGANMDYVNCSLSNQGHIEHKVVSGSVAEMGDLHKQKKIDFKKMKGTMEGFNQNVGSLMKTVHARTNDIKKVQLLALLI